MQTCTFSLNGIPIEIHHSHTTAALDLTAKFSPLSPATDIEILAAFATHCANVNTDVSIAVFQHIHKAYCASDNIHVVVQQLALSPGQAHTVLKGYYSVWDILESHGLLPDAPRPALFSEDNIRLVAMFGGQDGTGHYLDEAALLFDVYRPLLEHFVRCVSDFMKSASQDKRLHGIYTYPLDVFSWILSPETRPKAPYLALYPVSIMTVAVVQLMHLMVLYKTLRLSPGELSQSFKGAIGHCQGLAFAAMFASLTDEKSFYRGATKMLGVLMAVSASNQFYTPLDVARRSGAGGPNAREGTPSPMVAIRGIPLPMLNALLAEFNEHCTRLSDNVFLAIINGHENFVVTARTSSVVQFVRLVRSRFAAPDDDQSHSSLLQRRPVAVINYLPSNLVGHCELLASSADWAYMHIANNGWHLESSDLHIAVHTGPDGHDLRSDANATRTVVDGLTVQQIHWPAAVNAADATHIVDFSPGRAGVFARLTSAIVDGNGTTVISASSLSADSHARFGSKSDLFQLHMEKVFSAPSWQKEFGPQLVRTAHDKRICVDSPMTRALRLPPVVVLRNLPNATEAKYVAAISNAGYHVELCCDSILRENSFQDKVDRLLLLLEPGKGFAVNLAYHDQKQWSLDFPAILRKRREGAAITGLSISGSTPPIDIAGEIIGEISHVGIPYVAFRADTVSAVRKIIKIARRNPKYPVVIQVLVTNLGYQRSPNDLHQVILETYSDIRSLPNTVVAVGSYASDADDILPFITGDWSIKYGRAHMPIDGIILAPGLTFAKESQNTGATGSATGEGFAAGPIKGALQEHGEPGSYLSIVPASDVGPRFFSTRHAQAYQEIHDLVFSKPVDRQLELLRKHRQHIIDNLNAFTPTPWFGTLPDGRTADLQDMSYLEVVTRLVELTYDKLQSRWIDSSYQKLFMEVMGQIEDRFSTTPRPRVLQGLSLLEDPFQMIRDIKDCYPASSDTALVYGDAEFFVWLCKQPGALPVPFVPVLGFDLLSWISRDTSLGHGIRDSAMYLPENPVPIEHFLHVINKAIIDCIYSRYYGSDASAVPDTEYLGPDVEPTPLLPSTVTAAVNLDRREYTLPLDADQIPEHVVWLEALAGPSKSWLRALLTSPVILKGTRCKSNTVMQALKPTPGQTVRVEHINGHPTSLEIFDQAGNLDLHVTIDRGSVITLTICHRIGNQQHCIPLLYRYLRSSSTTHIAEILEGRDELHRNLQIAALGGEQHSTVLGVFDPYNPLTPIACKPFVVTEAHVQSFCDCVRNYSSGYWHDKDGVRLAPMDMLFAIAWPGFSGIMATPPLNSGQFGIIHVCNKISYLEVATPLQTGDVVDTEIQVTAIENIAIGRKVTMQAHFKRQDEPFATIESAIVTRDEFASHDITFRRVDEPVVQVHILSLDSIALLESKEWFVYRDIELSAKIKVGHILEFKLQSQYRYKTDTKCSSVTTTGSVFEVQQNGHVHIADVDYAACDVYGNAVTNYLQQHAIPGDSVHMFEHEGLPIGDTDSKDTLTLYTHADNWEYSRVSGDFNPIHTNQYLARIFALPEAICHGMWTSAATRATVERVVADGDPNRVRSFQADFVGMVFPGDTLETKLLHVGMHRGHMIIEGKTFNQKGEVVMTSTAYVSQPKTAYVFTGQGSQYVGMGMDFYESSPAARSVWDQADQHMRSTYGVSLLFIVRTNPMQLLVKFSGETGQKIRSNYLSLVRHHDGTLKQLIPEITSSSSQYTHRSETGLLNATLFTQPILVVMAMAQVADMRLNGVVREDSLFAGQSFGEVCSLACIARVVNVEDAIDISFYRGLLMQSSVVRDELGRSQYAMVSVNPKKVGSGFDASALQRVLDAIRERKSQLLEIVNYNIQGVQYVVAGHTESLGLMGQILDVLSSKDTLDGYLHDNTSIAAAIQEVLAVDTPVYGLQSSGATTVLNGIDLPYHSSLLEPTVSAFREFLDQVLPKKPDIFENLYNRYIPNMTGTPFDVSQKFMKQVYDVSHSTVVSKLLDSWDDNSHCSQGQVSSCARLLLIELLSFQIARPVMWIETQNTLLIRSCVSRLIEIGPNATLCRMARRTLAQWYTMDERTAILHATINRGSVYYSEAPSPARALKGDRSPLISEHLIHSTTVQSLSTHVPSDEGLMVPEDITPDPLNGTTIEMDDIPLSAVDILQTIVGLKLRKNITDIQLNKSVKELVAGKSTLQNEIISNIVNEFGKVVPENITELPLQEAVKRIGSKKDSLGKYTQSVVQRLFASKLPNAFSLAIARAHLKAKYGFGPQRQDAVLLVATTLEPVSRLPDAASGQAWLDSVANVYAKRLGIPLPPLVEKRSKHPPSLQPRLASSRELEAMKERQDKFALRQLELLAENIGIDLREGARATEDMESRISEQAMTLAHVYKDIGEEFVNRTRPLFSRKKARQYSSFWNWARQDAMRWIYSILAGGDQLDSEAASKRLHMLRNRSSPRLLKMLKGIISTLAYISDQLSQKALQLAVDIYDRCNEALDCDPLYRELSTPLEPHVTINERGEVQYLELPRLGEASISDYVASMRKRGVGEASLLYMCERPGGLAWEYSESLSSIYFDALTEMASSGITFKGKVALVTGCGKNSIGSGLIEALLSGGAKVIATTSSYNVQSVRFFEETYRQFGARGSELVLVPFNQASVEDVKGLVDYIYSDSGLGEDLDFVAPFATFPEHGKDMTSVDSSSELTVRILLTNILRMLGEIKAAKVKYTHSITPTLVVLPHSPNQGLMGNDGLYGETKAALHVLYNRWFSESWSGYISITGGDIGWTRSTKMTSGTVSTYAGMEKAGWRTFSREEMAFNIAGLLCPAMVELAHKRPLFGSFVGLSLPYERLKEVHSGIRAEISAEQSRLRAVLSGIASDIRAEQQVDIKSFRYKELTSPLANFTSDMPCAKSYEQLEHLRHLEGMVNLDKVVVVTGFGEVSSYGNAALRWEMEAYGEFSLEGCIELAWIMGLIKHFSGDHPATGEHYIGWVDTKTLEPVRDRDIKAIYEPYILEHTGIRAIEPELCENGAAAKKPFVRELQIDHDLEPFVTTAEEAGHFKLENGNRVDIWANPDGTWSVKMLKGAVLLVAKAMRFDRTVVAQLPTGWDPERFGIPGDLIERVDPVVLYSVVATMEALVRSGITDPYRIYEYLHVSEVGHSIGSCMGGGQSRLGVLKWRWMDKPVNNESLVESSINNIGAWINLLLLSSAGPLKPVVAACATSLVAIDTAVETIQSGKARMMLAGAANSYEQETSYELAMMNATSSASRETEYGRFPGEICRPCTATRAGFTEGYGAGITVLMSASAAIEMGAPVYGVVALSGTATDKSSTNLTAPGQGMLSIGRECGSSAPSPFLDIQFRRMCLRRQLSDIENLALESVGTPWQISNKDIVRLRNAAKDTWGNEFYKNNPLVSPLRGALAVWGLGPDDIGLASFHGTSTVLNDQNESDVYCKLMQKLGRTPGFPVPVACQKWLTGHPKSAAALFMLNGVLQSMNSSIVPGNRNADNIDNDLAQYDYLMYPSQSYKVPIIKAAMLTSFGMSQSGAGALIIHPDYLFATLSRDELEAYRVNNNNSMRMSHKHRLGALYGKHTFVHVKTSPPYTPDQESQVYLDPHSRARYDPLSGSYQF